MAEEKAEPLEPEATPDEPAQAEPETDEPAEPEDNLPRVEVTAEDLGALRKKLVITVPAERIEAKRDESIQQLRTTVQVPGFRIGRAPRRLIEKRYGTELAEDLKSAMVAQGYSQAIEQLELKVLGEPEMTPAKLKSIELPDNGPMTFDVEVEVQPQFELPELENIPVTRPKTEVTDADVAAAVDRWRGNFATLQTIEEPAKPDDVLTTDMTFHVEGEDAHDHPGMQVAVRGQVIEGVPLADLGEKLTGAKPGATVVIDAMLPEDFSDEALRGKRATLSFAVKEVKRNRLPELDDQFVTRLGFDKADEFRGWVRERLAAEADTHQQRQMRQQVYDYLLDKVTLELPEGVLGRMKERTLQRRANELMMRGIPRTEIEKHVDELSVHASEEAARELKSLFIMQRVAERLEVQVSEEQVNAAIAQMAVQYDRRPDTLRAEMERRGSLPQLYQQIQEQMAVDQLLGKARITDAAEAPPEPEPAVQAEGEGEDDKAVKPAARKRAAKKKAAKKKPARKADDADDQDAT